MNSARHIKRPTVAGVEGVSCEDAEHIKSALSSKGNESTVINILTKRNWPQRHAIATTYKERFQRDLCGDISSVFSGKALKVLLALMEPPNEFLAKEIDKALSGLRTDDEDISEILCTRSNEKIAGIQLAFQHLYGKTILSAINNDHNLSFNYKELLESVLCGSRDQMREPSTEKATKRAASIHPAVEEGWSTATKIFTRLLTHESFDQLCLIFDEYRLISGISMQEAIKSTFSGDLQYAYLAIVRSAIDKSQYYAETIEAALRKMRRDDGLLIRVFVSRAEIDLESIKDQYLKIYHKTLYNAIRTETKGLYQEILLALLASP
jgi:annexin A7/11